MGSNKASLSLSMDSSRNNYVQIYENYIPAISTGGTNLYPSSLSSASFIVNGTININSAFGGIVETSSETGILNTSSTFSNSVNSLEILTSKGSFIFASADKTDTRTEEAKAYLGSSSKPSTPSKLSASTNYTSKGDFWYLPL